MGAMGSGGVFPRSPLCADAGLLPLCWKRGYQSPGASCWCGCGQGDGADMAMSRGRVCPVMSSSKSPGAGWWHGRGQGDGAGMAVGRGLGLSSYELLVVPWFWLLVWPWAGRRSPELTGHKLLEAGVRSCPLSVLLYPNGNKTKQL